MGYADETLRWRRSLRLVGSEPCTWSDVEEASELVIALASDEVRERAASNINVQGERYPEHMEKLSYR